MEKIPAETQAFFLLRRKAETQLRLTRREIATLPIEDMQRAMYELQVHQVELEIQNEELRRAQMELEASRNRYVELYDGAPAGYLTLNAKGMILEANLPACTLLGVKRTHLVGNAVAQYVGMKDQPIFLRHLRELFRTHARQDCELSLEGQEDIAIRLESVLEPDETGEHSRARSVLLDITARKRGEALAQQYQQGVTRQRRLEEREQIAHDLHDGILQSLFAIGLNLETDKRWLSESPDRASANLSYCIDELNVVMREVRGFIEKLEAADLVKRANLIPGLSGSLRTVVKGLARLHDKRARVSIDRDVAPEISPAQSVEMLKLAKEAVSNSFRHARATLVQVSLRRLTNRIRLIVQDNGTGFSRKGAVGKGQGLISMTARARRLGGTLSIQSKPAQGTRVVFDLPKKHRGEEVNV